MGLWKLSSVRGGAAAVLLLSASAVAQPAARLGNAPAPAGMMQGIFDKLSYDREYFQSVLDLHAKGRPDSRMSREDFDKEVKRAQANVPVLKKLFDEKAAYDKSGKHLSLPPRTESHRVYSNLITLLNQLKSFDAKDWQGVLAAGERVVISDKKDLGLVRNEDAGYYLSLYREYFWLMAAAHYRLGNDREAVTWLAKVDSDVNVLELRKAMAAANQGGANNLNERLARLYRKTVAVVPPQNLAKTADNEWMGMGFVEVFTSDLVSHTSLAVAERANVAKVLKEVGLSEAGITDEKNAKRVGDLLAAGSLVKGSFTHKGQTTELLLELTDASDGKVLLTKKGTLKEENLFLDAREVLLGLFKDAGWLSDDSVEELRRARAPKMDSIRNLLNARLLLASKSTEAKALYEKAMKESPEYAQSFEDLRKSFEGINPLVAVMGFVNVSGKKDELWMAHGATEALNSDLPQIGFSMVERTQLVAVLKEQEIGQLLDDGSSREKGKLLGAEFVVLGSVMNKAPTVRVDARFVEVSTGLVLQTFDVTGRSEEFPAVLAKVAAEIARRFNITMTAEQLANLTGSKMKLEEFKRFATQKLQEETLARKQAQVIAKAEEKRANKPFWIGVGGVAAGAVAGTTGLLLAGRSRDEGAYAEALLASASRQDDIDQLSTTRNRAYGAANTWTAVGVAGAAVAVGSLGYLVYQELTSAPAVETTVEPVSTTAVKLTPLVGAGQRSATVGVQGTF